MKWSGSNGFGLVIDLGTLAVIGLVVVVVAGSNQDEIESRKLLLGRVGSDKCHET